MRKFTFLLLMLATSASAQVINVPADFGTIQQGIDAAQPGDTVLVADGTYFEQITINKKPLLITSNFLLNGDSTHLYNTVIDGSQLQSPNQSVVCINNVDTTVILAGFTIQNGRGTRTSDIISGGGIRIYYSGAKIVHNRIINNILDGGPAPGQEMSFGGGLFLTLTNMSSIIHNNLFKGNEAYSGAAMNITLDTLAGVSLENNTFLANEASTGGAIYSKNGTLSLVNNVFKDNVALDSEGGALRFYKDGAASNNVVLVNNTFSGNTAANQGGAIYSYNSNPILLNNIFWSNYATKGPDISIQSGEASMAYCNIDATKLEGDVNILHCVFFMDPLFCDTTCLAISCDSPCKNSGTGDYTFGTTTIYAPMYDNKGIQRPLEEAFDIGAHEFDSTLVRTISLPANLNLTVYPNPSQNTFYCSYRLEKDAEVSFIVYDLLGKPVLTKQFHQKVSEYIVPLQLKGLAEGVYLLKFQAGEKVAIKKVVLHNNL